MKSVFALISFTLIFSGCSPLIKQAIKNDPSIIYEALKKDPEGYRDAVMHVQKSLQASDKLNEVAKLLKDPFTDAKIDNSRPFVGPKDAPVTIIKYADYQCGYCARAHFAVKELQKKYGKNVRVMYKQLPVLGPKSVPPARYFEAISMVDNAKALEFHAKIYSNQRTLQQKGTEYVVSVAKEVMGADFKKAKKNYDDSLTDKNHPVALRLASDASEATGPKLGFQGTPAFLVEGAKVNGFKPELLEELVIQILKNKGIKLDKNNS